MAAITLRIRSRLRVRDGAPNTSVPIARRLEPGAMVAAVDEVVGESVAGNARWYELVDGGFVWSGAVEVAPASVVAPRTGGLPVNTYPNGRTRVLSDTQIRQVFGEFQYQDVSPRGAIKISPPWPKNNIVEIAIPALAAIGHSKLWVHKLAADPFRRAFAAIEAAGLTDRILSCGGTYVPRHKTWNPKRGLSSHSWGVAIDLNVAWNGYGVKPPPVGAIGSVRELVPMFAAEGFGWGGDFSEPDGMHFELALTRIP